MVVTRLVSLVAGIAAIGGGCAASGLTPGQASWVIAADSGGFITTRGTDTVAMEQFFLRGNALEVEAFTRSPRIMLHHLRLEWSDQGELRSFVRGEWRPGAPEPTGTVVRIAPGTTAVVTLPRVSPYAALARIALARRDSAVTVAWPESAAPMRVRRASAAWLEFVHAESGAVRVRLDALWRVQEVDARQSSAGTRSVRVRNVDVAGWARFFADREGPGK